MKIYSIELKNFRNYAHCSVEFDPFINILIGQNAQGKTNLLEAIYILSMSKSFKTKIIDELIYFDEDFAKIHGKIMNNQKNLDLEIVLSKLGKKLLLIIMKLRKQVIMLVI